MPSDYFNKDYKNEIIIYYNRINVLTSKKLLKWQYKILEYLI